MTFKHILVATDFSDSAERALDLAVEIAQKFQADLDARAHLGGALLCL